MMEVEMNGACAGVKAGKAEDGLQEQEREWEQRHTDGCVEGTNAEPDVEVKEAGKAAEVEVPVEANHTVDYLLDILHDLDSGNLKSVVEFLDRELEELRFIFDSCLSGIEMEKVADRSVLQVSDIHEIGELAVLLTETRYSLFDDKSSREKLRNLLIEHAARAAGGKHRLLALVL
ncbi:hypothetical protein [Ferroglobus placidus]|nr:hypothetical protein [Ferroglobus placidus]